MKRILLIDGYNLLFQFPELRRQIERDLEGARERLLDSVSVYAAKKQTETLVVFDGDGKERTEIRRRSCVKVIFSKPPQKADPLIKKILSEKKPDWDLVLITSDHEIARFARLCGVRSETSQKFASDMASEPQGEIEKKFDNPLSEQEVADWMELFQNRPSE